MPNENDRAAVFSPMRPSPMRDLIEHMLETAPEITGLNNEKIKAFEAQLYFIGSNIAGAVSRGPVAGTYLALTTGKDGRSGQDIMVGRFFVPESLTYMDVRIGTTPVVQLATEMPRGH